MKPNDLNDLQQITALMQAGSATRRDGVALLILVRENLSKTDHPMLLDIAHCVAHSKRDRGMAYEYIEQFLARFIEIVKKGGTLRVEVLFPIQDVIKELADALNRLGTSMADEKLLLLQTDHIETLLKSILDGIELKINNANIADCKFESVTSNQDELFSFSTHFVGLEKAPILQVPINVAIAFPVFK